MDKVTLTHAQCVVAAKHIWSNWKCSFEGPIPLKVFGVPRGGIPVAYLVAGCESNSQIVATPGEANLIVDDLVDSGKTRERYQTAWPKTIFMNLKDALRDRIPKGIWVVFPWEEGDRDCSADDIVTRLLEYVGEDPNREGLKETPARVLKAWKEWTKGYEIEPASVCKFFEDGGESYDEMVVVKDLPFYSHCEHHLAPFFGTATIAYIPERRVIGLSKIGRILEIYARRLQVQERMTVQIADTLNDQLKPKGVGVLIKARHFYMESRGISTQGHQTVTSALRGRFLDGTVRSEFLNIA